MQTQDDVVYYWSARRQAYVVYALGLIQFQSYHSVDNLLTDWPKAQSSGVMPPKKEPLPAWLGGDVHKEGEEREKASNSNVVFISHHLSG